MRLYSHAWAILIAFLLFFSVSMVIGTSIYLRPGEVLYARDADGAITATWTRGTPLGSVWLHWATECQSLQSGVERGDDGRRLYQATDEPVSYRVDGPIGDCFADGLPVRINHSWKHYLFGVIPLRPVRAEYTVTEFVTLP